MIPGRPPFSPSLSLCAPPVDPRAMAWQAFRYGMDGIVVPRANDWPDRPSASVMPADAAWLIWPGKPFGVAGPIPSIRLKRLRRGLQDVEYLRALKRLGDGEMADKIARALFHCGGSAAYEDHFADGCQWPWTADPELWDLARRLVADRIAQLKGQARPDENRRLARAVEWRRFVDGACKLRVYCEGVRVRSSDDASGGSADIEFYVVIRNDRLEVVTGQVRFGKLPVGWQPVAGDRPVKDLPSLGRARMSLVARATSIGTNDVGIAYVPIVFDAGPAGTVEILARLPQLTAMRLRQPVAIDGDLSDWPAGLRNVAGDFIEVAGQDPTLAGREPTGRARQQTLVFVGVDDRRLYFAFNCREDRLDALPTTSSNFVRYDGLLPAGDDLLEILIDPTNAGTGQPIDIYRVVIRPTGAAFAGRGVETQAGWGSRRHWPADVRVATSRQDRAWSAEVSIPLSAFGQAGRSGKRWAVNFARYQSRLGEYSSWSGARRYFYNTRSFGNLTRP